MSSNFYERIGDEYDLMTDADERAGRELPVILDLLGLPSDSRILEIGCATGALAAALGREGHEVIGLDPVGSFITMAKGRRDLPASVSFVQAHFEEWFPHRGEAFDAALCLGHTLPHLVADRPVADVMRDIGETLRPGGQFLAQMVNPSLVEARGHWEPPARTWERGGVRVTLRRRWIDRGDSLQLRITRITDSDEGTAQRNWDQTLPKVRSEQIAEILRGDPWTDLRLLADVAGNAFEKSSSPALVALARRR